MIDAETVGVGVGVGEAGEVGEAGRGVEAGETEKAGEAGKERQLNPAFFARIIGGGDALAGKSESVCSRSPNASIPSVDMTSMHRRIVGSRKAAGG